MKEMLEELRRIADDLKRHAGTNEMHHIAEISDRLYHLAVEVKRIDDIVAHHNTIKNAKS